MENKEMAFEYSKPELVETRFATIFGSSSCDDYSGGSATAAEEIEITCEGEMDD